MEVYAELMDDGCVLLICLECFTQAVQERKRLRALERYARRLSLD